MLQAGCSLLEFYGPRPCVTRSCANRWLYSPTCSYARGNAGLLAQPFSINSAAWLGEEAAEWWWHSSMGQAALSGPISLPSTDPGVWGRLSRRVCCSAGSCLAQQSHAENGHKHPLHGTTSGLRSNEWLHGQSLSITLHLYHPVLFSQME